MSALVKPKRRPPTDLAGAPNPYLRLDSGSDALYEWNMSYSNIEGKNLPRSWRVTLIRNGGELLGYVDAADSTAAELAAIQAFDLSEADRKRLMCASVSTSLQCPPAETANQQPFWRVRIARANAPLGTIALA
jgi:hypothetical protein